MLALIILGIAFVQLTGIGKQVHDFAPPAVEREVRFIEREDGLLAAHDAATDSLILVYEPGEDGFVRGVLRGLGRERRSREIPEDAPYRIARRVDGIVTLEEPRLGVLLDLRAFGIDNLAAFARLLPAPTVP